MALAFSIASARRRSGFAALTSRSTLMKDVRLKGRPANVSGFSCAGRARRDPRQLQAGVGQRLGRTFSLLKEMTLVTDPSPGTGRLLEERNAAKTARAGEVLFAPTGAIVLR